MPELKTSPKPLHIESVSTLSPPLDIWMWCACRWRKNNKGFENRLSNQFSFERMIMDCIMEEISANINIIWEQVGDKLMVKYLTLSWLVGGVIMTTVLLNNWFLLILHLNVPWNILTFPNYILPQPRVTPIQPKGGIIKIKKPHQEAFDILI